VDIEAISCRKGQGIHLAEKFYKINFKMGIALKFFNDK